MGVNNRQRRAAKQRRRASQRRDRAGGYFGYPLGDGGDNRLLAATLVLAVLDEVVADRRTAVRHAQALTGDNSAFEATVIASVLDELLTEVLAAVLRGGWSPSDLGHIVRRRLDTQHLPPLAALLAIEMDRHPRSRVSPSWREELAELGEADPANLLTPGGVALALGLCSLLQTLPVVARVIAPPGAADITSTPATDADAKLLARVRALLAKAESTEYPEEAEALSAKAQELISRYALDRMAHQPDHGAPVDHITACRLWIDPPYLIAKAMLIDAVAGANRCRSVISEELGFSTVVGEVSDLRAVELLVTSLLVQADTAMLRHGRQADRHGMSRTTSFRRSFLVSYATRIGERLRASNADAVAATGRAGELVPVLRRRSEHVDASTERLFPYLVPRETSISNGRGWAAGRVAADLALIDINGQVTEAAAS